MAKVTVVIEFKGVKLELDLKEAKELQQVLEGITGEKVKEYIPYPVVTPRPWPWWSGTYWSTGTIPCGDGDTTYQVSMRG